MQALRMTGNQAPTRKPNEQRFADELFGRRDAATVHRTLQGDAIRLLGRADFGDASGSLPS